MGKTYIDTVKYLVYADVNISGLVEKPDVVGAIFGQTEGLLGDELDLRDLQKNGRIGRIEVELQAKGGKSIGKILLPSSLDMVETSILAAALETVDRVGPCDAKINVQKIEDTRNVKRKQVVDRAKSLLKNMLGTQIPESKEISDLVRKEVKIAEISEYGPEKLPSGPNLDSHDSIVIVEGRADVINLLKNDVNNAVAIGGANVPSTLADLCQKKETTVFLDGDRGGDIILRELTNACEIDFVARAPRGKEVEELTRKELIKCMRSKVPLDQYDAAKKEAYRRGRDNRNDRSRGRPSRDESTRSQPTTPSSLPSKPKEATQEKQPGVPEHLTKSLNELENTLRARLYDTNMRVKSELPVRDLVQTLAESDGISAVVLDGIITQRLVDLANSKGVKTLVGVKLGNIFKRPDGMVISTKTS